MNNIEKSLFNLIEIFRSHKAVVAGPTISKTHCEEKYHHDFYCDAEKPFVSL